MRIVVSTSKSLSLEGGGPSQYPGQELLATSLGWWSLGLFPQPIFFAVDSVYSHPDLYDNLCFPPLHLQCSLLTLLMLDPFVRKVVYEKKNFFFFEPGSFHSLAHAGLKLTMGWSFYLSLLSVGVADCPRIFLLFKRDLIPWCRHAGCQLVQELKQSFYLNLLTAPGAEIISWNQTA